MQTLEGFGEGLILLLLFVGLPYFLAKRKGKDPLKFIVLSLFFSFFVWMYLIFCKSEDQKDGQLSFYKSLRSINGVSVDMADNIMELYPNKKLLRKATISELQEISGIGEKLAVTINKKFK